jgi:hypothetical protein
MMSFGFIFPVIFILIVVGGIAGILDELDEIKRERGES